MRKKVLYHLVALSCVLMGMVSCVDDFLSRNVTPGDGESFVTFSMTFRPEATAALGKARSEQGDAIKDIKNLFIAIYTLDGNLYDTHYIADPKPTVVKREDKEPVSTTELETQQVTFRHTIPYGLYHIYAVANMGDLNQEGNLYKGQLAKEDDFRKIRFAWDDKDIPENKQMSGYFTNDGSYPTLEDETKKWWNYNNVAAEVEINDKTTSIHAWLRRAASKVTIAYDATKLKEGIYIYLKSVQIKNIPASCSLIDNNTPEGKKISVIGKEEEIDDLIADGDRILYDEQEEISDDPRYILTKGDPYIEGHDKIHDNDAQSLFFYENMQGKGEENTVSDKRQNIGLGDRIAFPDGGKGETYEGWRDAKPNGTYIEVDAYYVSNAAGNVGRGPIKYRFMLGKDIITDYNAERNYHYKLTLQFNGTANDVDWHIEYKEEDFPGLYVPNYYVSYVYNQPYVDITAGDSYWEKCYPIRLAGDNIGDEITVRITENNWGPTGETGNLSTIKYYKGEVKTAKAPSETNSSPNVGEAINYSGVWHGFLSLYKQEGKAEISRNSGEKTDWLRFSAGEYIYWYSRGQRTKSKSELPIERTIETEYGEGYRTYSTKLDDPNATTGEKIYEDRTLGSYKVVKSVRNGVKETTVYVPLFTRPLIINQKKGFTGNNPYFSFQRTAKIKVTAKLNGETKNKEATVRQVRRLINPKGIFRSHDNITPFTVTLMYRTSERAGDDFVAFKSEGAWRATIVAGEGWQLGSNGQQTVNGSTGTHVVFEVKPMSTLEINQTACALVRVEYHDYHCVHYIHLRQGYAPLSLDNGQTYWHSFNMKYTDGDTAYETDSELDEGSVFRYGNVTQAIDAINNTFDDRYQNTPHYNGKFVLAPIGDTKRDDSEQFAAWADITPQDKFGKTTFMVDDVECRMPIYDDFKRLKDNSDIDYSLGLCYGDEANSNAIDDDEAFYYSWYARTGIPAWLSNIYAPKRVGKDLTGESGVRGCFVYNHKLGDVIFFPLGAGSNGRRKDEKDEKDEKEVDINGTMRYGDMHDVFYPNQQAFVPQLYALYENFGAIYWVSDQVDIGAAEGPVHAWDINYTGIDFNPIFKANLIRGDYSKADAALIRLVQDDRPTLEQCKKIDARFKAFQGKK